LLIAYVVISVRTGGLFGSATTNRLVVDIVDVAELDRIQDRWVSITAGTVLMYRDWSTLYCVDTTYVFDQTTTVSGTVGL